MFKKHVVARLQSNARFQNILDARSLFEEGVNYRSSGGNEGGFKEVAENGEDGGESPGLRLGV